MTPAVFVFGTSHPLQCGAAECEDDHIALFEQEIQRVLSQYGIRRIAEEMSEDGLREWVGDNASGGTVCRRIAPDGVPVDYVDLGAEERACLSLSDGNVVGFAVRHFAGTREQVDVRDSFSLLCGEVRERVWVGRVLSGDEWPVLFVCGADHAVSISRLFARVGVESTIICRDFDPDHPPSATSGGTPRSSRSDLTSSH